MLITRVEKLTTIPQQVSKYLKPNENVFELVLEQHEPETLLTSLFGPDSVQSRLFEILPEEKTVLLKFVDDHNREESFLLTEKEEFDPKDSSLSTRRQINYGHFNGPTSHLFVNSENKLEVRTYTPAGLVNLIMVTP